MKKTRFNEDIHTIIQHKQTKDPPQRYHEDFEWSTEKKYQKINI